MLKRMTNKTTYRIETETAVYAVTLSRLNNGTYGNPRYEANIICLLNKTEATNPAYNTFYTPVYRFGGHYCGDEEEARYIVNRYEEERNA